MTVYGWLLVIFLLMGFHGAVIRQFFDYPNNSKKQKGYITSIIIFQAIISLIIILILNFFGPTLWMRFTAQKIPFNPYVRLMLWSMYFESLLRIPIVLYQAQQKARQVVYIQYSKCILGIFLSLIFIVILKWGAYGVLLSQLLTGLIMALIVMRSIAFKWFISNIRWEYIRAGLAYGLPLIPHLAAWQIINAASRMILERYVSLAELGLFNFGYMLGMVMYLLVMGINQAWAPYYYNLMNDDPNPDVKIIKIVSKYVVIIGSICLFGVLFAREAVYFIMPSKYYVAVPYIAPFLTGYLLVGYYYFAAMPLQYYKKTLLMPVITGTAAILNVILNLLFIPKYGAIAAAWISTITYAFCLVVYFLVGRRFQRINYPLLKYGFLIAIILIATVFVNRISIIIEWLLIIKFSVLIIYISLAYLLLLKPKN